MSSQEGNIWNLKVELLGCPWKLVTKYHEHPSSFELEDDLPGTSKYGNMESLAKL